MSDHRPNLRCKNCWRPYAMHAGNAKFACPIFNGHSYEPDTSSEAPVYAAVEELIAMERADSKDRAKYQRAANALSDALQGVCDAARAERSK